MLGFYAGYSFRLLCLGGPASDVLGITASTAEACVFASLAGILDIAYHVTRPDLGPRRSLDLVASLSVFPDRARLCLY